MRTYVALSGREPTITTARFGQFAGFLLHLGNLGLRISARINRHTLTSTISRGQLAVLAAHGRVERSAARAGPSDGAREGVSFDWKRRPAKAPATPSTDDGYATSAPRIVADTRVSRETVPPQARSARACTQTLATRLVSNRATPACEYYAFHRSKTPVYVGVFDAPAPSCFTRL